MKIFPKKLSKYHLTVDDLYCHPGPQELFNGLSLSVVPGKTIELRGLNGCGKSTLLRVLAGLQQPDRGDVTRYVEAIGYVGHSVGLAGILTVKENLKWASALAGVRFDPAVAHRMLVQFQLLIAANTQVSELSAGEKRRCSFIRLVLGNYKLWLLDEPFTSIDTFGESLVREYIQTHCTNGGSAVIASHASARIEGADQVVLGSC